MILKYQSTLHRILYFVGVLLIFTYLKNIYLLYFQSGLSQNRLIKNILLDVASILFVSAVLFNLKGRSVFSYKYCFFLSSLCLFDAALNYSSFLSNPIAKYFDLGTIIFLSSLSSIISFLIFYSLNKKASITAGFSEN